MTPRLIACHFDEGRDALWSRFARVLERTAAMHCPAWSVEIAQIPANRVQRKPELWQTAMGVPTFVRNTHKLAYWNARVQAAAEGEHLLLIDVDTMILRPLDDVWSRPFDLAYTVKRAQFPLNGGVIFLRVSDRVKRFVGAWVDENARLLTDTNKRKPWQVKYGGINQAALGHMLEQIDVTGVQVAALPCQEWNCEDSSWSAFDPAVTRIVHLKSLLRRACVYALDQTPDLKPLSDRWRALDRATSKSALVGSR